MLNNMNAMSHERTQVQVPYMQQRIRLETASQKTY